MTRTSTVACVRKSNILPHRIGGAANNSRIARCEKKNSGCACSLSRPFSIPAPPSPFFACDAQDDEDEYNTMYEDFVATG